MALQRRVLVCGALMLAAAGTVGLPPATADVLTGLSVHATPDGPAILAVPGCTLYVKAVGLLAATGQMRIEQDQGAFAPHEIVSMPYVGTLNDAGLWDAMVGPITIPAPASDLRARPAYDDPSLWSLVSPPFDVGGCPAEPRCDGGHTRISSTFNSKTIEAGDTIWASAVFKPKDRHAPAVYHFERSLLTYTVDGIPQAHVVPDAMITFSPSATSATTDFDTRMQMWITQVPLGFDKPVFLTGLAIPVTQTLPGGIKPVTWSGQILANAPGLSIEWKWAAAVYDGHHRHEELGVKPIDGSKLNAYANSDHAGTPEHLKDALLSGARGGGGSNYTGSLSGTTSAQACYAPP